MAYQSLYRRYRSQKFSEIVGQEHVVQALTSAIAEERHSHAYLFSGPRGTGKTSMARIAAKALNCENPVNGEPDGTCKSCLDIEAGRSFDLHELDAASNNKVDDVRDLIAKVALGSPGRTKVYILDEVHMLSTGAENALLKTLEEPPAHVVFVLATTEPHKVVPTIRSRTQHFEFHLIGAAELEAHLRFIVEDAELSVDEDGIQYAIRQGGGSARDTLSALELVAAAGGVPESSDAGVEIVRAIGQGDPATAIASVQTALERGLEPRTLGEATIETLRGAFLASMGAGLAHLSQADQTTAAELASELGPGALTRSLETLGSALVEMRQASDPRVPLEVALLRLARRDGADSAALIHRIEALEAKIEALSSGGKVPAQGTAPSPSQAPTPAQSQPPAPEPAATSEPTSTSEAAAADPEAASPQEPTQPTVPSPPATPTPVPQTSDPVAPAPPPRHARPASQAREALAHPAPQASPAAPSPEPIADPTPEPSAPAPVAEPTGPLSIESLTTEFETILASVSQKARARFKLGSFSSVDGSAVSFAVPNEHVITRCEEVRIEIEGAISARFGQPVTLNLIITDSTPMAPAASAPSPAIPKPADNPEEIGDVSQLEDAPDAATDGAERLTQAFPGSRVIDNPQN